MEFREQVGKNLKFLRKQKKLTLKELSDKTNISISTLTNYENNYTTPKSDKLALLATFYGVSENYLYTNVELSDNEDKALGIDIPFSEDVAFVKKVIMDTKILDKAFDDLLEGIEPVILKAVKQFLKESIKQFPLAISNSSNKTSPYHYVFEELRKEVTNNDRTKK